jgi:hypothetical protein
MRQLGTRGFKTPFRETTWPVVVAGSLAPNDPPLEVGQESVGWYVGSFERDEVACVRHLRERGRGK